MSVLPGQAGGLARRAVGRRPGGQGRRQDLRVPGRCHGSAPAIGLKCGDRETADLLVERYPGAVAKSPYVGKHGWNIITLDGTIPDDEVAELVDTSYALVVAKLPKKDRPQE